MALTDLSPLPLWALPPAFPLLYLLLHTLYNLYLHPLARHPGPLLMRATRLGYCQRLMRGTLPFDMLALHRQYGPVVRIAPDELAFQDPAAWRDIMGHRTAGGGGEFEKSQTFYRPVEDIPTDIVNAGREEHGRLRRTMAHGFSERAMREQQGIIGGYVDLLIEALGREGGTGKVDVAAWYNYATFDVIGDLAFGER